jgi:hypothetical protein
MDRFRSSEIEKLVADADEPTGAREAAFASWMMVGSHAPPA